ncbi:hypothetical protein BC567DRAFT_214572 [Phyllosticta citribraziliensis]
MSLPLWLQGSTICWWLSQQLLHASLAPLIVAGAAVCRLLRPPACSIEERAIYFTWQSKNEAAS